MAPLDLVYIAAPYKHEDPLFMNLRYEIITKLCGIIVQEFGCSIFSPITHGHPIPIDTKKVPGFNEIHYWMEMDLKILKHCSHMFIIMMDGWVDSKGLSMEIEFCNANNIEMRYIEPSNLLGLKENTEIARILVDKESTIAIMQTIVKDLTVEKQNRYQILTDMEINIDSIKDLLLDDNTEADIKKYLAKLQILIFECCNRLNIDLSKEVVELIRTIIEEKFK